MIWGIGLALIGIAGLYLMRPFLAAAAPETASALDQARQQRAAIDLDAEAGRLNPQATEEARDALDRRILALLDEQDQSPAHARLKSLAMVIVPAVLLLGVVGVYTQVGAPDYQPLTYADYRQQQLAELPDTLEELVVVLQARLESDPNPPLTGYVLLARSYLRLGEFDSALAAYDTAIEISDGNADVMKEREGVVEALQNRATAPPIDPDARARIEAMSPDEQAAMISSMVDGLAVRLEQNPDDFEGWMRLIRARAVMGDAAQARLDLGMALENFPLETREGQALQQLAVELLPPTAGSDQE
ncbi:MAG: c-type cytochrome biogenesis protein CcmI [Pseudomonadota bacterium]